MRLFANIFRSVRDYQRARQARAHLMHAIKLIEAAHRREEMTYDRLVDKRDVMAIRRLRDNVVATNFALRHLEEVLRWMDEDEES